MFQAAPCHVVLYCLTGPYSDDRMTQNCLQSLLRTVNFQHKHVFLLFCFLVEKYWTVTSLELILLQWLVPVWKKTASRGWRERIWGSQETCFSDYLIRLCVCPDGKCDIDMHRCIPEVALTQFRVETPLLCSCSAFAAVPCSHRQRGCNNNHSATVHALHYRCA